MVEVLNRYVTELGGDFPISKILIASNGLAALKGIRSIKKWAYGTFGNEHCIKFVAMATKDDIDANAEFIKVADEIAEVPEGPNIFNYANVDLIVSLAIRHRVQAVWAGWGHASENPRLPDLLTNLEHRIVFIGPSGKSMRSLGDKISSMIVAQTADVATVPWSGSGLVMSQEDQDAGIINRSTYLSACCSTVEEGLEVAKKIGLPVMIKASEGGGGKGIRRVDMMDQFGKLFKLVQSEVPGSPIFVMKVAENARHLEVQLICDKKGNATTLFGRDCSVQRRHQKIIEEAPISVIPADIMNDLEQASLRLAKLVGYENVGTVEFLYDATTGKYCFLELNPRLQVEHPTTEMASGVNIPACQLMIAMGIPLQRISFIRKLYKQNELESSDFDMTLSNRIAPLCHVVSARITAEDPMVGFKPNGGSLKFVKLGSLHSSWGYFSVQCNGKIHDYSDSQFGHIFAQGESRQSAIKNLVEALRNTQIQSDFRTNLDYVGALLELNDFRNNQFSTAWLDGLIQAKFMPPVESYSTVAICAAAVLASSKFNLRKQVICDSLKKHQYPSKDQLSLSENCKFILEKEIYDFQAFINSSDAIELSLNGHSLLVRIQDSNDGGVLVTFGREKHLVQVQDNKHCLNLIVDGRNCLVELDNDPSSVRAPSSGRIVKMLVENGSKVAQDTPICEIEVMKMYLPIYCQGSGVITFRKQAGNSIHAGDILASIELDDKNGELGISSFSGSIVSDIENIGPIDVYESFQSSFHRAKDAFCGFYISELNRTTLAGQLVQIAMSHDLPFLKILKLVSAFRSKLPSRLTEAIECLVSEGVQLTDISALSKIDGLLDGSDIVQREIKNELKPHLNGPEQYVLTLARYFVDEFIVCEKLFDTEPTFDGPLKKLFASFKEDIETVAGYVQKHSRLDARQELLVSLLEEVKVHCQGKSEFLGILRDLTTFQSKEYARLSRRIREISFTCQMPSLDDLFHKMEAKFENSLKTEDDKHAREKFIYEMVHGYSTHLDVLPRFFHHSNLYIRRLALEIYTQRVFSTYLITASGFIDELKKGMDVFEWSFSTLPKIDGDDGAKLRAHRSSNHRHSSTMYPIAGLHSIDMSVKLDQQRRGYMVSLDDLNGLRKALAHLLALIGDRSDEEPNHLYLVTRELPGMNDSQHGCMIQNVLQECLDELALHRVRRITVALVREQIVSIGFYTYSQSNGYKEDLTLRHIEPAMAYLLEFPRLINYDIDFCFSDSSGQVRIYRGTEKLSERHQRLFVRLVVRPQQAMRGVSPTMASFGPQAMHVLEGVLEAMEAVQAQHGQLYEHNHLFISIEPVFHSNPSEALKVLQQLAEHYRGHWAERHIRQVEVRMCLDTGQEPSPNRYRFYLNNETGYVPLVHGYKEGKDPRSGFKYLISLDGCGPLNGWPVTFYYTLVSPLEARRAKVLTLETPYVYDFPAIFEHAVRCAWRRYASLGGELSTPSKLIESTELVLAPSQLSSFSSSEPPDLLQVQRAPGLNNVGMISWKIRLFTPEAPTGRDIIVIANDISFEIGSFGLEEDRLFSAASKLARSLGIPRIYLAANSGARLGLADELRGMIRVAWHNADNPDSGFDYLYLEPDDYECLKPGTVLCDRVNGPQGEVHYRIRDIIGAKHGLGVENLSGSALIASETSHAYNDIFTISFVTGRSVGIGAYLIRLGQRVIQKAQHPIILTGVGALNNLLGREVYQSNLQLGGPQVMFANGVSHRVVSDDLEGVQEILDWLSFVPLCRLPTAAGNSLPPILRTRDNALRSVAWSPPSDGQPYDPRFLIEGTVVDGQWQGGLFDRSSFIETMSGWARTVITGRARLGGMPVGVIATETRMVELVLPADPADLTSTAHTRKQAGQVWFPDSALKTAQAIRDFSNGEALPIMILANWRGFSGGQRDLYEQVLKFGAMIVDALVAVEQPVIVYLPPGAELRGGAWVVIDSQINSECIEMYADPSARGGILEPEGIVGVKFRPAHLHVLMERLDATCSDLAKRIEAAATPSAKEQLMKQLTARRAKLLPIYRQIAAAFADAHDTPGRMKAKKAIREIVPWKDSRAFFYHRLRRLNAEAELLTLVKGYRLSQADKKAHLKSLLIDSFSIEISSSADEYVFDQLAEHMVDIKDAIKKQNVELAKAEISRITSEIAADLSLQGLSLI